MLVGSTALLAVFLFEVLLLLIGIENRYASLLAPALIACIGIVGTLLAAGERTRDLGRILLFGLVLAVAGLMVFLMLFASWLGARTA